MRIVVTGTRGIPDILGGVETHCQELFPRIVNDDVEVIIFRRKEYAKDAHEYYKGIRLVDISAPKSKAFEAIIHTFKSVYLARFKYHADILHVHAVGPALLIPFAKLLGLKVVFTHHGPDYDREKWGKMAKLILKTGERVGVMFADKIISISTVISDNITRWHKRENIELIYNGVPDPVFIHDNEYLEKLGLESRKYIFAMGRFVPEKKFDDLIHAFASLRNKGFRLVLAGDNIIEDQYSQSLKDLAMKNDVVLTGFIKGAPLYTLLSNARGFVLPSTHEGLPIAMLEAMSYHLPVIVSDIPANKAVGLDDESYFRVNDVVHLNEKIQMMINAPFDFINYDMRKYDWDNIAKQITCLYRTLNNR